MLVLALGVLQRVERMLGLTKQLLLLIDENLPHVVRFLLGLGVWWMKSEILGLPEQLVLFLAI